MSNLDWLGLVLAICCGSWFGFAAVACVMSYRRRRGPAPLPGALGDSPWPVLDEWEAHCDDALSLFADPEQYHLDLWDAEIKAAR